MKYKTTTTIICMPNQNKDLKYSEITETKEKFLFDKNFINIIYWGRIDYRTKGIDRLLVFAKNTFELDKKNIIKFHLMGPDYNDGLKETLLEIEKLDLVNKVFVHPSNVWKDTKEPLIQADYSILLARWDWFPKSLRESIHYNVPIIITEETNFCDLVKETNCGVVLNQNKNDQMLFIDKLITNKNSILNSHKLGCKLAKHKISPLNYRNELCNFYKSIINS